MRSADWAVAPLDSRVAAVTIRPAKPRIARVTFVILLLLKRGIKACAGISGKRAWKHNGNQNRDDEYSFLKIRAALPGLPG